MLFDIDIFFNLFFLPFLIDSNIIKIDKLIFAFNLFISLVFSLKSIKLSSNILSFKTIFDNNSFCFSASSKLIPPF